jgi:hypothetical protein
MAAEVCLGCDVCTMLQQQLCNSHFAIGACDVQGGDAISCLAGYGCTCLQQRRNYIHVPCCNCNMQRHEPVAVGCIDVKLCIDENIHKRGAAPLACMVQYGIHRIQLCKLICSCK